jgi:hypothetical protein
MFGKLELQWTVDDNMWESTYSRARNSGVGKFSGLVNDEGAVLEAVLDQ